MSQATRIIVCRRSQAARGRTGEFQGYVREDKNARSSNGPWKEKLQISWGKPATNLACMRTQQEVPKVTGRLDRHHSMVGRFCLCLSLLYHAGSSRVQLAPGAVPASSFAAAAPAPAPPWPRGPAEFGRHRGRWTGMRGAGSCGTEMVDPKLGGQ